MTNHDKCTIFKGDSGTIIADHRYPGLHILTWIGSPSTQQYDAYMDHRLDYISGSPVAVVCAHDLSEMITPAASMRKHIGDRGAIDDDKLSNLLCYYVAVPNPIARGIITAISWVGGAKVKPIYYVSNLTEALNKAFAALTECGVKPPDLNPASYVAPPLR